MTTSSFKPIIRREAIVSWNPFAARPRPEPGVAIVLVRHGRPTLALLPDDQLTWSQVRWGRYQWAYWIDISEQTFTLQCPLPSRDQGLEFKATAYVAYKICDPLAILRSAITDTRTVVEPMLLRLLRRESRQYTLDQCPEAEQAIRKVVKTQLRQADITITRCIVTLDVEEDERNHARTLRAADRHYAHTLRNITYTKHLDELDVPLARKQIEFYRELAKSGDLHILWLYLANHRDDIQLVLKVFNEQRQLEREHWLRVLKELRADGGIEALHLEHLRTSVLDRLAELERQGNSVAALSSGGTAASAGGGNGGGPPSPASAPVGGGPAGGPVNSPISTTATAAAVSAPVTAQPANGAAQPAPQVPQEPLKEREVGGPSGLPTSSS